MIATQIGDLLKYDTKINEVNRAAQSVFSFQQESFPNDSITSTRAKHLIPLAGKPLIQYTIESLQKIGVKEILIITGYLKKKIEDFLGNGEQYNISITYEVQKEYLGTAHAAKLSESFIKNDNFILMYGDLLIDDSVFPLVLKRFRESPTDGIMCLFQVKDPEKFGIAQLDKNGYIQKIIEKPKDDKYGNLANAGVFVFDKNLFDAIKKTPKSIRSEYELTDSLQILIDQGHKIKSLDITGLFWSDIGHPWQVLDANQFLMDKIDALNFGYIEDGVKIIGKVHVGRNTLIKSGTRIEGPVYIGENCIIGPNSFIRPYTSIGDYCQVGNASELKNTIMMDHCHMAHLSYAGDSIIGSNVNFGAGSIVSNVRFDKKEITMNIKGKKISTGRTKMGAVIGDNVQLGINSSVFIGVKIGANSWIGPSTNISEDVEENMNVYVKQEKIIKSKK
jgi:bifunctional UDP-N-acetylglucosamine pyrophosphorylase/glucosamine-1-phosphate N-acetyltransferase